MRSMVENGEVDNLVAERVWQELEATLGTATPSAFFITLDQVGALQRVAPELAGVMTKSQPDPETQSKMIRLLQVASNSTSESRIRFAALCTEFNAAEAERLEAMCNRLRAPKHFSELAIMSARFASVTDKAEQMSVDELHSLIKSLDAARRPERFEEFLDVAKIRDYVNSVSSNNDATNHHYSPAKLLRKCVHAISEIDAASIARNSENKMTIGTDIKRAEIEAITAAIGSSSA